MAGGPTVTLTFAGDAGPLKRTIASVGTSVSGLSSIGGTGVKALGLIGAAGSAAGVAVAGAMAGGALAIGGLGIAAAAQSEKVKSAFTSLKDDVTKQVQELAKPFEPVLLGIANQARTAFAAIAPAIGSMFQTVAPMVGTLATGVLGFVQGLMPGLQALTSAAGPVVQTLAEGIGNMGDSLSGFLSALATGAPGASAALSGVFTIVNGLLPVIGQLLASLSNAFGPVIQALAPVIVSLVQILAAQLTPILTALAPIILTLGQTIGAILGPVLQALGPPILAIVQALSGALVPVLQMLGAQFVALMPVITPIIEQIGGLLVQAIQLLAPLLPPLVDAFFQIVAALLPIIPPLLQVAGNLLPMLAGILSGVVVPIIQNVVVPLIKLFADRMVSLAETAASISEGIRKAWDTIGPKITEVVKWVTEKLGQVINFMRELPGKVTSAVGNLGSTLLGAGKDLLTGLWNGISGAASWLKGKISSFFGSLLPGWAKDFLGIHSPSTLFRDEIGKFIPLGLAAGIEGNLGAVSIASAKMAAAAADPFGNLGDVVKFGSVSQGTWDSLLAAGWKGRAGDSMEALYRPSGSSPAGGGGVSVSFGGNVDSAFATAFMKLVRSGQIQLAVR
jgi:phage-related protein